MRQTPLSPQEADALPNSRLTDLVPIGLEAPDLLLPHACRGGGVEELVTQLEVPPKARVQLTAQLTQIHRRASLQRETE
jgi:hypothetical protein